MNRLNSSRVWRPGLVVLLSITTASAVAAEVVKVDLAAPTLDRWNYPFANDPGGNSYAAVFASLASTGFDPMFDNRDGQMIVGYDTADAGVEAGLNPLNYTITSAVLTVTVETGNAFSYDPTPDPYEVWLPPSDPDFLVDADPGHAIEVFGTGFRYGFNAPSYAENSPYSPLGSFGKKIRTAYPVAFKEGQGIDVSNNVDEHFDPIPFGVGVNSSLTPGQVVPGDTPLEFALNVSDPDVQRYLQRALHEGMLDLTIASIFPAEQQQSGAYPRFYTKENLAVVLGLVDAARLQMTVEISDAPIAAGDVDANGVVDVDDLLAVISSWGACPYCAADLNFDNDVNVDDLLIVINTWS